MPTITAKDGAQIFYKDWGSGQPVVFSHGWPLNADAWDEQLFHFASNGYRAIAHDRRGHGRSTQTWTGNDMDTYADDLASLVEALNLTDAIHIGHSTGGGEVTRYIGRHGTKRVSKAVLVDAVTPGLVQPGGLMIKLFDDMRAGVFADVSQFWEDLSQPFYGANRSGAKVPKGILDRFWLLSMQCGLVAAYDCIRAFSESDFTADLAKFDIPTLIIHGDDDQIVPIDASARRTLTLVPQATLTVYPGFSHGMCTTNADRINQDLLAFIQAERPISRGHAS
jgi:non-heme chloroperoxidase